MNRDRLWGFDSESDLITADVNDRHHDIVADHDAFISVSGKDEHSALEVIEGLGRLVWDGTTETQTQHGSNLGRESPDTLPLIEGEIGQISRHIDLEVSDYIRTGRAGSDVFRCA